MKKAKYSVGDEVYWTDPDGGECSGIYKVTDILVQDGKNSIYQLNYDTEVFEHELS